MPTLQFSQSVQVGGVSIAQVINVVADHPNVFEIDVPAGLLGQLTTRTDNDTGIVTVATGHGITDTHLVDLYTPAGVLIRKDLTVTAVTGTTVSVDGGTGSNLPTLNDPLIIARQVPVVTLIDNANMKFFAISLESPAIGTPNGRAVFEKSDDSDVKEYNPLAINSPESANIAAGQTNPLAGDPITKARISNGNTTAAKLKLICMEDATP